MKTTISSRLKCPICFEVFYKPRRLYCGYLDIYLGTLFVNLVYRSYSSLTRIPSTSIDALYAEKPSKPKK